MCKEIAIALPSHPLWKLHQVTTLGDDEADNEDNTKRPCRRSHLIYRAAKLITANPERNEMRLDTDLHHDTVLANRSERQHCVLCCKVCVKEPGPHVRSGRLTQKFCRQCQVYLCSTKWWEGGRVSCFDLFHTRQNLPIDNCTKLLQERLGGLPGIIA